jgi:hypothetical protein
LQCWGARSFLILECIPCSLHVCSLSLLVLRTYEAIESGFVDQALVDLSGGIGSRLNLNTDPDLQQQARNGVLFNRLLQYRKMGFLLGAGTPAGSDSITNASLSGIVQGHAYAILVREECFRACAAAKAGTLCMGSYAHTWFGCLCFPAFSFSL